MASHLRSTAHGTAALEELAGALQHLQSSDRLAAVTVIVPSNSVGVAARRWLARHGGVAAVQFLTLYRLAELLGGPALVDTGRRPVSSPVVDLALRESVRRVGGSLADVAHHRATVEALRATYAELRQLDAAQWDTLAEHASRRGRDLVAVARETRRRLASQWYDERDLLDAAIASPIHPERVVLHLPEPLRPAQRRLVQRLGEVGEVIDIRAVDDDTAHPLPPLHVVELTDPDEEAREAVHQVLAAASDGVPLDAIGVVWPTRAPYARLVTDQLTAAGVQWNGQPGARLVERLPARVALGWLTLDEHGMRRGDVFELLSSVPAVTEDGRAVPVQFFERVSRRAGVHGGDDWRPKLERFASRQRDRWGASRDADAALELAAFVDHLRAQLGAADEQRPPSAWADAVGRVVDRWLRIGQPGCTLGADDLAAADVLERILLRLRGLDSVLAGLTRRQMAELLEAELDAAPSRVGRIGSGVQVGPLAFGVGQPLDVLVVVGAAEGLLPAPPARSGLLSDADRALIGDDLPPATAWPAEQRRHLAAALAGAARAVVCSPRGDLRGAVLRVPSRLIDEWAARTSVTVERRASFVHTVAGCTHPPTVSLARAGALVRSRLRGHDVRAHALVDEYVATRHGVALLDGRAATTFTEYDGMIGTVPFSPSWATATTLERWAKCPYAFFLREVLGVQETVDPAQVESILPTDRGALVHGALDDLHRAVLDGQLPQPVRGWTREHAEVLEAAFRRRCDEAEATGLTGYPALWAHERDRQWDQLVRWLAADGELLVDRGATVLDSEWRVEGAELSFPSGVTVSLRGNVDRIDLCPDRLVITDHKSGKVDPIDPADPTQRGTRLQLPLYGLAARHHPGVPEGIPISVEYSSLSTGSRPGLDLDDRLVAEVHTRVQHIVDSIAAGIFIALPPAPSGFWGHIDCPACDPDGLGTASAHRRLLAKQGDPAVAAVLGDLTHDEQAVPT